MSTQNFHELIHIANDQNFQSILDSHELLLVDFWANWCGPCRAQLPILEEFVAKNSDVIHIAKLDVDDNPVTTHAHNIKALPSLIIFQNGKPIEWLKGLQSLAALQAVLDRVQSNSSIDA